MLVRVGADEDDKCVIRWHSVRYFCIDVTARTEY